MKKKIFSLLLALTLTVTLFTACGKKDTPDNSANGSSASGTEETAFFSAFETETLEGKKATEKIFTGNKVTMINVWGTFCSPCIGEMPDLQKLSEAYKDKDVRIIGVLCDTFDVYKETNIPEKVQDAKNIVAQTGVKYTNLLPSASLNEAKLNSIYSVPTTFFLNEKGELIGAEIVGSKSYDQWCAILDNILEMA